MSEVNQYADRDLMALDKAGNHYCRHVDHMTREGLHSKSDIAAELGWRDMQIDELKQQVQQLASENAALKGEIANITFMKDEVFFSLDWRAQEIMGRLVNTQTPATDAWLNEVRAQGIEMAAIDAPYTTAVIFGSNIDAVPRNELRKFAARIRSGEVKANG